MPRLQVAGAQRAAVGVDRQDPAADADDLRMFAEEGDLRNAESQRAPGSTVPVEGERAGVPFKVDLVLIQRNPPQRG